METEGNKSNKCWKSMVFGVVAARCSKLSGKVLGEFFDFELMENQLESYLSSCDLPWLMISSGILFYGVWGL